MRPTISFYSVVILAVGLAIAMPVSAQSKLVLTGGTELSGLTHRYDFQQFGATLQRGWRNPRGRVTSGLKLGLNVSLHYRPSARFALETGLRVSAMNILVYDDRFMTAHGITGTKNKNNLNGTYPDQGNFSITEWYASNYLSAYYFIVTHGRFQPYYSVGVVYSYFASIHSDISTNYLYPPTSENLELNGHFVKGYFSGYLEAGVQHVPDLSKPKHGLTYFIGLKYIRAGTVASADYSNTQNGSVLYTDHVSITGTTLAVSLRVGIKSFGKGLTAPADH